MANRIGTTSRNGGLRARPLGGEIGADVEGDLVGADAQGRAGQQGSSVRPSALVIASFSRPPRSPRAP
jgi:hypothetical protein